MKSLEGTILEVLYTFFGVHNDDDLCTKMTNVVFIYTVIIGIYTAFVPAPYGRYSKSIYGPTINAKLGWMIQECMAFFCPAVITMMTPSLQLTNYRNKITVALFMMHYLHRSFIYPFAMSGESKPTPIATVIFAIIFCTYNGLLQGIHLANVGDVSESWSFYIGVILFLVGMVINITHDRMLTELRKKSNGNTTSGENSKHRYKIPHGGLFDLVSCANYFGEILEWTGLAVATRLYPQIVFAIFTATFLGSRAIHNHQFYKETFGSSYPPRRKAIIPFVL